MQLINGKVWVITYAIAGGPSENILSVWTTEFQAVDELDRLNDTWPLEQFYKNEVAVNLPRDHGNPI